MTCICSYHQYKFIVDGEWRHDETQPFMPDPLGNVNNWLFVRRAEQSQNQGYAHHLLQAACLPMHPKPFVEVAPRTESCTRCLCMQQDLEQQPTAPAVAAASAATAAAAAGAWQLWVAAPFSGTASPGTAFPAQPTACILATPAAPTSISSGSYNQLALQPERCRHAEC